MNKSLLIVAIILIFFTRANAQKWPAGSFTDIKGNKVTGFINDNPGGKGPIKDEGFIEFKDSEKTNPYKLSASDLKSYMVGKDSFVVAHAPFNQTWTKKETDFVKVELDEETKLYVAMVGLVTSGDRGPGIHPTGGIGYGTGGYGGAAGGVSIDIGHGGSRTGKVQATYYYGANTAQMKLLTSENFVDVMSDIMGDEQDVVDKIRAGQYILGNIHQLIAYYKTVKASHAGER